MQGVDRARLRRADEVLRRTVEEGRLPMASAIVLKDGEEIYRGFYGLQDVEAGRPVQDDTIYRTFSMSKVITAVAFLTLYEQGLVGMDDPVYEYLPAFRDQQVVELDAIGQRILKPARTPNTIRNLLTMTSGIPYYHAGRTPAGDSMSALYEQIDSSPWRGAPMTTQQAIALVGGNPLDFHPGERFYYGLGIDVLGAVIEQLSGKTLGQYCREAVLEPLGMEDTGFWVPPEKQNRLSGFYKKENGRFVSGLTRKDERQLAPPLFEEGGDGIVTTTRDYAALAQMLLNGGSYQGRRVLGRKTVEYMTRNQLHGAQLTAGMANIGRMEGGGYGYGLGVRVLLEPERAWYPSSAGQFGWCGKGGSWFGVDPAEGLVMVFHTQDVTPGGRSIGCVPFVTAVYAALE